AQRPSAEISTLPAPKGASILIFLLWQRNTVSSSRERGIWALIDLVFSPCAGSLTGLQACCGVFHQPVSSLSRLHVLSEVLLSLLREKGLLSTIGTNMRQLPAIILLKERFKDASRAFVPPLPSVMLPSNFLTPEHVSNCHGFTGSIFVLVRCCCCAQHMLLVLLLYAARYC
ncbi:unnamed protein product, partial [Scytosiphon promiscuus]